MYQTPVKYAVVTCLNFAHIFRAPLLYHEDIRTSTTRLRKTSESITNLRDFITYLTFLYFCCVEYHHLFTMSSRNTISTRFLIISDTHGTSPFTSDKADPSIPKADVLLHCGDISNFGNASEYEPVLSALKAADAELKIVIAGNHDLTLDKDYIKNKIGWDADDQAMVERAKEMWSGPDARANGLVYLEEDVLKFT